MYGAVYICNIAQFLTLTTSTYYQFLQFELCFHVGFGEAKYGSLSSNFIQE